MPFYPKPQSRFLWIWVCGVVVVIMFGCSPPDGISQGRDAKSRTADENPSFHFIRLQPDTWPKHNKLFVESSKASNIYRWPCECNVSFIVFRTSILCQNYGSITTKMTSTQASRDVILRLNQGGFEYTGSGAQSIFQSTLNVDIWF